MLRLGVLGIEFLQTTFEPQRGQNSGRTVARTDDVDEIEVVLAGEIVEMCIDESQARTCSPVSEKSVQLALSGYLLGSESTVA